MAKFIKSKGPGLLDQEFRAQELRARKRGILALDEIINWEEFRGIIEAAVVKEWKGNKGRPMFPPLQMFKVLVIQNFYHLSDERMEETLLDSDSFKIFAGFSYGDHLPDQKTIWRFREQLKEANVFEIIFHRLNEMLTQKGIVGRAGVIVDAAFVEVPRQNLTMDQKAQLEKGNIPPEISRNPNILRQKDLDAKWGFKNKEHHHGYKVHIKVDVASKFVMSEQLTPANVHDSKKIVALVKEGDKQVFADKAYHSTAIRTALYSKGVQPLIHEKGSRGHPLQPYQKEINKALSSIRAKVEHVFGDIEMGLQGLSCRYIGEARVHAATQLKLFLYNIRRMMYFNLTMHYLKS